jgi:hypothetical protein
MAETLVVHGALSVVVPHCVGQVGMYRLHTVAQFLHGVAFNIRLFVLPTYGTWIKVYLYIVTFCPTHIHVKEKYKLWLFVLWLFVRKGKTYRLWLYLQNIKSMWLNIFSGFSQNNYIEKGHKFIWHFLTARILNNNMTLRFWEVSEISITIHWKHGLLP